jgi:predicted RNase H-like HicB family nuclease
MMRYAIVIEKAEGNYSAYVPDLPGCVATGDTVPAVEAQIREAIRFHIEGSRPTARLFPRRPASQNTSRPKLSPVCQRPGIAVRKNGVAQFGRGRVRRPLSGPMQSH